MTEPQKKGMGKSVVIVLAVLVIVLIVSTFYVYTTLRNQIHALSIDKTALENQVNDLSTDKTILQNQVNRLQTQYDSLYTTYTDLNSNYVSTVRSYQALQSDYSSLSLSYDDLQRDYEAENILRIGNSLESYYDYVRINMGPQTWWSDQQYANFAASLALQSLGKNSFPTIESEFYTIVGIHSYEMAREKLNEVADSIGLQSNDTPVNNIRKTLQFINQHIHYEKEISSPYLSPIETMGFKSGDCEDFSILAAALFEKAGIDAAFGSFKNNKNEYHAMVLVHLENLGDYDFWYYSDLTHYGLASGKWIIIEPQATMENQHSDWIRQWTLVVATSLD